MSDTKELVLNVLPLGSTVEAVELYALQNFKGRRVNEHDIPDSKLRDARGVKYICYRVKESGIFPVGSNWTEILFYFDEKDKLSDVVVADYGVWM